MPVQKNNAAPTAKLWNCASGGAHDATHCGTKNPVDHPMALYSGVLLSWLEKHDAQYFYSQPPQEVRKLVKDTLDLLVGVLNYFSCPTTMLAVVIKYADAFVMRNGIRQVVLLHLLFISTITTIKMWGTENMAVNQIIADLFRLSLVDINNMEREFLKSLNYELYLTDADVSGYLASITAKHVASVLRHRVRTSTSTSTDVTESTPVPCHSTPQSNKRKAAAMYNSTAHTPSSIPAPKRRSFAQPKSASFLPPGTAALPIVV